MTEQEQGGIVLRPPVAVERKEPTINEIAMSIAQRGDLAAVEAVERLFRLQVEKDAIDAKRQYMAAMARLAPRLPVVDRNGRVKYDGKDGKVGMDRKYGKYEDIDEAIRPLYSEEGFSVSWKTAEGSGGKIRMIGTNAHRDGHSEDFWIDLPHDSSGGKNAIQAIGSTVLGYGRRMLTTMIFNVRIAGIDADGEETKVITPEHLKDVETGLSDTKADMPRFLKHFGIEKVADLTEGQYKAAMELIDSKRRAQK